MKCIWPDNITAIEADEETTNYDIENVQNNEPSHLWKATTTTAQIKLTVAAYSSAVGLLGLEPGSVTITVKNETETSTLVAAEEFEVTGMDNYMDYYLGSGGIYDSVFYDYGVINVIHTVIIDVEVDSGLAQCGIIRCGLAWEFPNPNTGFSEQRLSHSIEVKYPTGGMPYIKTLSNHRILTGQYDLDRDTESQNLLNRIAKEIDLQPTIWQLLDLNNHDWVIFGKLPAGRLMNVSHDAADNSYLNMTIEEIR